MTFRSRPTPRPSPVTARTHAPRADLATRSRPPLFGAFGRLLPALLLVLPLWGCGGSDGANGADPSGPDGAGVPTDLLISPVAGGRETVAGGPFPAPVAVTIRDAAGNPVPGVALQVEILAGGGWVAGDPAPTDAAGQSFFAWYAGPDPAGGTQRLRVRGGGLEATAEGTSLPPTPGTVYLGHRDFVEYTSGTLPLVLTAPHGGTLLPSGIPDRSWGTTVRDLDTDILALLVADALEARTGERPHLVRLHLHRRKLDANREIGEAAQGNPDAERAWFEFHAWTEVAMATVRRDHPRGLYMDVHGHGHEIQRLELGYLLSASDLALDDSALDAPAVAGKSSMREVAAWTGMAPHALVRGEHSLGALFEERGYRAVPSPGDPHPDGAPYFTGGYNTRRYGCVDGGTICGFQLEANRIGVRDSAPALAAFAEATAEVLLAFLERHYGDG